MEEYNGLELAIESCQDVERSLMESIKVVRRLNIRFNTEWLIKNYRNYIDSIIQYYESPSAMLADTHFSLPKVNIGRHLDCCRSFNERTVRGSTYYNGRINCRFIKFKRSMETLMIDLGHAIDIANRQKNYVHVNAEERDSKTRLCFH